MSYTPTSPASATLHSVMDPNGGTLYKDAGCTTAATTDGDVILGNKDGLTANVAGKIGTRNATLHIVSGVKSLRVTNTSISNSTAGAALQWTTGALDPANSTVFFVYKPDRRGKLVTDLIADIGNSPGGTGATVVQLGHDSGNLKMSSGGAFGANGFPFISPDKDAEVYCYRGNAGVATISRADTVNNTGDLRFISLGANRTSTPSATGWVLGGRNAANLFTQSDFYLAVAFNGVMTDAEVAAEIAAIKSYLTGLGMVFTPGGSDQKLIVDGDSNSMGTGATQTTTEWGQLLQDGCIAGGITGLQYESFGASSRKFTELAGYQKTVIDAINATTGRVVYVVHCGENDATVSAASTILTNAQAHFTAIRAGVTGDASRLKIVWLGIPARNDISGASLTSYDNARASLQATMLADPTLGGLIDGYVDITGDSLLGASGAALTTTYFNGDKVHYNNTGQTRVYNGTDGAGSTLLATVLPLFVAPDVTAPAFSSANVPSAGTTVVVTLTEANNPPLLPATGVTGFTVKVNGVTRSLSSAARSANTQITLTLSSVVYSGDTVTVAYTPGNVTDSAGTPNAMAAFTAQSVTNNSVQTAGSTVTGVSVSPSSSTLHAGQQQDFSATVSGTNSPSQAVAWSVTAGSVSASGQFVAPAATGSTQTITITATSSQDGTKTGTATVTVPAYTVTGVTIDQGLSKSLEGDATFAFTATVTGVDSPAQTGTWSKTSGVGSINGSTGVYTAPAALPSESQTAVLRFTSSVDNTKWAEITVTVLPEASGATIAALPILGTRLVVRLKNTLKGMPAKDTSGLTDTEATQVADAIRTNRAGDSSVPTSSEGSQGATTLPGDTLRRFIPPPSDDIMPGSESLSDAEWDTLRQNIRTGKL